MTTQTFQFIETGLVKPSDFNLRHHWDRTKREELKKSISDKGILTPLLVRPQNGYYEIAAGHRRYDIAREISLKEIPVIIREMDDKEFLEILTIENLQREDIHPLDEANGYRNLMEKAGYDVAGIAAKIGKSESYVYQRLKLSELIPEVQKSFIEDKITAGHAILIARLQPKEQKEALNASFEENWRGDRKEAISVRELNEWINENIHLDLNSASFSKKDPDLLPEAGPCTTCPKRTGFQPQLFPDIKKKDTCTDPECFKAKVEAFVTQWIQKKSQETDQPPLRLSGEYNYRTKKLPEDPEKPVPSNLYHEITDRKKDSCPSSREGIVIEGRHQGRVLTVCTDPDCKKHHSKDISVYQMSEEERARRKSEKEKIKIEETIRDRLIDLVLAASREKPMTTEDWAFITTLFFTEVYYEKQRDILRRFGVEIEKNQYGGFEIEKSLKKFIGQFTAEQFPRLFFQMAVVLAQDKYAGREENKDLLAETAKRYGLNPKAIGDDVRQEFKEKKKAKKKASPKKPKSKPGVCGVCGCTDEAACEGDGGIVCAWADKTKTLCSMCAKKLQTSAKKRKKG